jgi:hypothetical protein
MRLWIDIDAPGLRPYFKVIGSLGGKTRCLPRLITHCNRVSKAEGRESVLFPFHHVFFMVRKIMMFIIAQKRNGTSHERFMLAPFSTML